MLTDDLMLQKQYAKEASMPPKEPAEIWFSSPVKQNFSKRIFDFTFSFFALILFSPVYLIIAIFIKLISPDGPVFFSHYRVGQWGQMFKCYKFRTMVPNARQLLEKMLSDNPELRKEFYTDFKLKNDPRIIPGIGNFLRRTSLDELPQFFNALIGDMSVIGPRPIVEDEKAKYGPYLLKFLSVKPGISGLWQVSGRNDITYDERILLDMEYIDNVSLFFDFKVVLQTIYVMLFRKGAY